MKRDEISRTLMVARSYFKYPKLIFRKVVADVTFWRLLVVMLTWKSKKRKVLTLKPRFVGGYRRNNPRGDSKRSKSWGWWNFDLKQNNLRFSSNRERTLQKACVCIKKDVILKEVQLMFLDSSFFSWTKFDWSLLAWLSGNWYRFWYQWCNK
jgi:hypothetical protein